MDEDVADSARSCEKCSQPKPGRKLPGHGREILVGESNIFSSLSLDPIDIMTQIASFLTRLEEIWSVSDQTLAELLHSLPLSREYPIPTEKSDNTKAGAIEQTKKFWQSWPKHGGSSPSSSPSKLHSRKAVRYCHTAPCYRRWVKLFREPLCVPCKWLAPHAQKSLKAPASVLEFVCWKLALELFLPLAVCENLCS